MSEPAALFLKHGEDRRLRAGHLWVFSNEVDTERSPLRDFEPGDRVVVYDARERPVGCAYVNPHSLICARLVSRDPRTPLGRELLARRLEVALALRRRLFERPFYRLAHGEADGLPGLAIDRYDDVCVAQLNTAGMERARDELAEALATVIGPRHVLWRCDAPVRELEGLTRYVAWAGDEGPAALAVEENGARFEVPAVTGQKTGWYYDHRANRAALAPYVAGLRVLDGHSYAGAWAVQAALAGAREVVAVESSPAMAAWLRANVEANAVGDRVRVVEGDLAEVLATAREEGERFDVVILDPPPFVRRKRDRRPGRRGYWRLNRAAMQALAHDGLLVTASCSAHVDEALFEETVLSAARHLDRSLRVVEHGRQAADHPTHPAIPETRYLKTLFARVLLAKDVP